MVITRLYGGLGNQMFQYAAGVALARRLRADLYTDVSSFQRISYDRNVTQRIYELDGFGITPRPLRLRHRLGVRISRPTLFCETAFRYDEAFGRLAGHVILDGYWQSFRYFEPYAPDIHATFRFPQDDTATTRALLGQIQATNSVAVHVRRGDYASPRGQAYHGLIPVSYYRAAIGRIADQISDVNLFIFSDDIAWCRAHLQIDLPKTFVDSNRPTHSVAAMQLISACKHAVIANSSFSWWAAWLNQNPAKLVCAPVRWFAGVDHEINDRVPVEWIRL
jgi:hypothetical protein